MDCEGGLKMEIKLGGLVKYNLFKKKEGLLEQYHFARPAGFRQAQTVEVYSRTEGTAPLVPTVPGYAVSSCCEAFFDQGFNLLAPQVEHLQANGPVFSG